MKITIVGAGIVGICCALKLQSQGHSVVLMDKDSPAEGCSKGNAGHFATEQIFPMASFSILKQLPKMLLNPQGPLRLDYRYLPQITPWLIRFLGSARKKNFESGTQALKELNQRAMPAYEEFIKLSKSEKLIENNGYILAFEGARSLHMAEAESQTLIQHGVNHSVINQNQLNELEPQLNNVHGGVYFPDICHTVDPYQFALKLFNTFVDLGGEFEQKSVNRISHNSSQAYIHTDTETIRVDKLVIAAGAHSASLLKHLNIKVPLDTERGYHQMVPMLGLLNRPVAFAQRKFIITPMSEGTRLAGTVEFAGLKRPPRWKRAEILFQQARHFLDPLTQLKSEDCEQWMGFRPSLPDSLPVIDRCPEHDNVFLCFGHQHLGLTQAAVSAEIISELITQGRSQIDHRPFSVQRF